eukprot:Colp12_sorted_trinity150504_noHs@31534
MRFPFSKDKTLSEKQLIVDLIMRQPHCPYSRSQVSTRVSRAKRTSSTWLAGSAEHDLVVKGIEGLVHCDAAHTPRVFRLPGNANRVKALKREIQSGAHSLSNPKYNCHDYVTLLKNTMTKDHSRRPLVPRSLHKLFLCSVSIECDVERANFLQLLMSAVPQDNIQLLRGLFTVVAQIVDNSGVTEMNVESMAICLTSLVFNFKNEFLMTEDAKECLMFIIEQHHLIIQQTNAKVASEMRACEAWNVRIRAERRKSRSRQWWRRLLPRVHF